MTSPTQHERFTIRGKSALLRTANELGVTIPYADDIGILLTPVDIGSKRVPNRLLVQPMEGCDAEADGSPGPLTLRRYQRFAAGGSGLIWFEATAVMPEGRANPAQLLLHPANVGAFRRLAAETRAAARAAFGDRHEPMLILQLTHSGRYSRPDGTRRPVIAHHSRVLDAPLGVKPEHPLISDDQLDELQDAFVRAARLAAEAGFDGVDIKACHGYLVSELLAARTREGSRYGGALEDRLRFLLETVARVRDDVPDILVTSRISAYDGIPYPYGFGCDERDPPLEDPAEPTELARQLRKLGCPLLSVSAGNPYYNPHYGRPYDVTPDGDAAPPEHPLVGVSRLLRVTATVQRAVPDAPIVGTGYSWLRQSFPHVGAAVVAAGEAGLVGLGRGAIAYPGFAKDLMRSGRLRPKSTCSTCSGCTQLMRAGRPAGCRVHDAAIYGGRQTQPATDMKWNA